MRRLKKYKKYNFYDKFKSNHTSFSIVPSKISSFKKTKWKVLQGFVNLKYKKTFINNSKIKVKSWSSEIPKVNRYFKENLALKNNLFLYFNNSFKTSFWKKTFNKKIGQKKSLFLKSLVYPEFRLDILANRLELASSSFAARQSIHNGEILVNKKRVSSNYIIKSGDIISFGPTVKFLDLRNSNKIFPFLEVDYYTKTIIVLVDWHNLDFEDSFYFVNQFFNLQKLKNFF